MPKIRQLFFGKAILKIIAANMRDGEVLGLHKESFTNQIGTQIRKNLERSYPDKLNTTNRYIVELENVCLGEPLNERPYRKGSKYILKAKVDELSESPEWFTTVLKVENWLDLIDSSELHRLIDEAKVPLPFKPMAGGKDPLVRRMLESIGVGKFVPKVGFMLGTPLVWVTRRDVFSKMVSGKANKADAVRDYLGLVHRHAQQHLIALHIPATVLSKVASNRPTFADAGGHRRFFALAEEQPPPYPHDWGQTLDLHQLRQDVLMKSGGPERVSACIEMQHFGGLPAEFEYLGSISYDQGDDDETNELFSRKQFERNRSGFEHTVSRI